MWILVVFGVNTCALLTFQELEGVVEVAPAARPWRAISGVALRPAEVDRGKARFVKYGLVGQPKSQLLIPPDASRQLVPLHMPAVVCQRGVIKEVGADDPVHLQVLEMVGDALEEALAN